MEKLGRIVELLVGRAGREEMLELLTQRLGNAAEAEIKLAAGEQLKITRIRLERIAPL